MNLVFGWIWILIGFFTGMLLGLRFADETWLGGYGSHPRRLLRLGHISLIMLGILNILFSLSAKPLEASPALYKTASWSMLIGGVAMPLCCALMAWNRKLTALFAVPVLSLMLGVGILCWGNVKP